METEAPGLDEGRRFARRMYVPRIGGLALGFFCIGGGLWEQGAPLWLWILLAINVFGAPHFAYWRAMRSKDPYRAELGNLVLDSVYGGIWIAVDSLKPSLILAQKGAKRCGVRAASVSGCHLSMRRRSSSFCWSRQSSFTPRALICFRRRLRSTSVMAQ